LDEWKTSRYVCLPTSSTFDFHTRNFLGE
jgi:hypothetical protein